MREHESVNKKTQALSWQPPTSDIRVITLILCCFLAGIITAARLDVHIVAMGNGKILTSLIVSVTKYGLLLSLCGISLKNKLFIPLLLLYDSVCAMVYGFFIYAFFVRNTAVLTAFSLPMLIYIYVITVMTGDITAPMEKQVNFSADSVIITKKERFIRSLMSRAKIIGLAVFIEGIVAPFVK